MVRVGCLAPLERSSREPGDLVLRRLEFAGMVKGTFERRVLRGAGGAANTARHTHREGSLDGETG